MGWSVERFPSTPDQELLCGICGGVFQDAVASTCGHTFCSECIETWLRGRSARKTCPQCRTNLAGCDVVPIYSLRQLVSKICIYCENRPRGCTFISRLEDVVTHTSQCGYAAHRCNDCGITLNRRDVLEHINVCYARSRSRRRCTARPLEKEEEREQSQCGTLEKKIGILEIQLKHSKKRLELCQADNRKLKRELSTAKAEIISLSEEVALSHAEQNLHHHLKSSVNANVVSPDMISKISLLILSSLRAKPLCVNADDVFMCIERHYEKYATCGTCHEYDVHMMIATAYASNWFSGEQRVIFHHWLNTIAKYRKYVNVRTWFSQDEVL